MGRKARRTEEHHKYLISIGASCEVRESCPLPPRCRKCGREKTGLNCIWKRVRSRRYPEGKDYPACRHCESEAKRRHAARKRGEEVKKRRMSIDELVAWYRINRGEDACWTGHHRQGEYATTTVGGKSKLVARAIYEHCTGIVLSPDVMLDHHDYERGGCGDPECVNPGHVVPTDAQGNARTGNSPSGINARKRLCVYGHLLPEPDESGRRTCVACPPKRGKVRDSTDPNQTALFDLEALTQPADMP